MAEADDGGRPDPRPIGEALDRVQGQLWHPPVVLLGLVTLAALPKALSTWTGNPIFSLGLLVVPWSLWWVLKQPVGDPVALPWRAAALAATLGLALTGWVLGLTWAAIWAIAAALVLVALERDALTRSALPVGLVLVTTPPPAFDRLLVDLQAAVAWSSEQLLALAGTPVTREALALHTPSYTFLVEPICTGLSGLLATVALVGIIATHQEAPRRRVAAAMGVGTLAAVVLNLIRIVLVVLSAEAWGPILVDGAFHGLASLALSLVAFAAAVPLLFETPRLAGGGADG